MMKTTGQKMNSDVVSAGKNDGALLASPDVKIVELNICVGVTVFRLHLLR